MNKLAKSDMLKDALDNLNYAPIDPKFNEGPRDGELKKPLLALDLIQALADNDLDKAPLIKN